jgi:hypothetical protein
MRTADGHRTPYVLPSQPPKTCRSALPKLDPISRAVGSGVAPSVPGCRPHDRSHTIETSTRRSVTPPDKQMSGLETQSWWRYTKPTSNAPKHDEGRTRAVPSRPPNWIRTIRRFQPSCHPTNANPHECGSTTIGSECATPNPARSTRAPHRSGTISDPRTPPKRRRRGSNVLATRSSSKRRTRRTLASEANRAVSSRAVSVETEVEPASRISFRVLIHRRARSRPKGYSPSERPLLSWTSPSLWCSPSLPWCEHLPSCTSAGFAARDAVSAGASGSC